MADGGEAANESEMALAAAVQQALLGGDIPECDCGKIHLRNRTSAGIGGDFYHFRELGQDQVLLAIGDVMGHGTGAALLMSLIKGNLQADQTHQRQPSRVVGAINELLLQLGERTNCPIICSLIYGVVDLPSGLLLYVNAGHPEPVICNRRTGKTRILRPTTMVLGVQAGDVSESCHQFRQDDRLVLFTDGLSEARDGQDELFTQPRLRQCIAEHADLAAEQLSDRLFEQIDRFTQKQSIEDDQTLVVIDFDNVSTEL